MRHATQRSYLPCGARYVMNNHRPTDTFAGADEWPENPTSFQSRRVRHERGTRGSRAERSADCRALEGGRLYLSSGAVHRSGKYDRPTYLRAVESGAFPRVFQRVGRLAELVSVLAYDPGYERCSVLEVVCRRPHQCVIQLRGSPFGAV